MPSPIISSFCNGFDNTRASFNEHYVTAIFQLVSQTAVYSYVYFEGLPQNNVLDAGLALQSPYIVASIATIVVLLLQRPYLAMGKVGEIRAMIVPALGVVMADGALGLLLNISVYWLREAGNPEMAAWVGTFLRLFQSFLSPALLVLFPVTTFISMRWPSLPEHRRDALYRMFTIVGTTLWNLSWVRHRISVGPMYVDRMFKLSVRGDKFDVVCIKPFCWRNCGAEKAYTMLLYAVTEAKYVSFGTAMVSALGVGAAAVASHWLSSIRTVDVLFVVMGGGLPILLLVSSYRYRRARLVTI